MQYTTAEFHTDPSTDHKNSDNRLSTQSAGVSLPVKNRKLGKYEILERLGRGGMAEVYRAYHASLDRFVAVKVLHSFLSDDPEFKARFEKEAQNIAKLRHPNIVQVYDFEYDEESESYYMVMELIEGTTLRDLLYSDSEERASPVTLPEVLRIIRESATALSYAHQRNMIHRDVKPANLMIDTKENNRVVLTDFGIAKLMTGAQFTMSGGMIGTPAYMAPEQGMGESGDERSDLYALGVIMYQMLTGDLPYDGDTPLALMLSHMNDPIPSVLLSNPHLPPAVDKVLQKLLAKTPEERYQSAESLIDALEILEKSPSRLDPATLVLPKAPLKSGETDPLRTIAFDDPVATKSPTRLRWVLPLLLLLIFLVGGGYAVGIAAGQWPVPSFISALIATATHTPSPTFTPSETPTATPSETPTATSTDTPTATPTDTATPTLTAEETTSVGIVSTDAVSESQTPTPSATLTSTRFVTSTPTANFTLTAAVDRTQTLAACTFNYAIVEQNPADGYEGGYKRTGDPYTREITLLNAGTCAWQPNSSLSFVEGENFNSEPRIWIRTTVEPGDTTILIFEGTLPAKGDAEPISGTWQLKTPEQINIGEPLIISVLVFDPGSGQ